MYNSKLKSERKPFNRSLFNSIKENKDKIIPKLPIDSFSWSRWRLGYKIWYKLGIACREADIFAQAKILRYYAIGYFPGDKLYCRPKQNEVAVLFLIDNEFCWTHLREKEFNYVFGK